MHFSKPVTYLNMPNVSQNPHYMGGKTKCAMLGMLLAMCNLLIYM